MSRKKDTKRFLKPDYKYSSKVLSKFINKVMLDGKKTIAEKIVYDSLDELAKNVSEEPLSAFNSAIENVAPKMEVKSRRVGGSTYQVPIEVDELRGTGLAMDWIIKFSRSRKGRSMVMNLSQELTDAYNNVGSSAKKRDDTHKMAESNKAFAHFRW
ncbi:MAG: 30S ribosomal protein S7 [Candidatus Margulisbacteria bacterium]|nr:30S ribosomal protein S7 [Candidatus Margulisiibacteriota bacterium]